MSEPIQITEPCVVDIPAKVYHADPVPGGSLSSSGARKLLSGTPATFDYERKHGQEHKDEFDFGTAAHKLVLGVGEELRVFDHKDWRTKDAKADKAKAYADGAVPLLRDDYDKVQAMAKAIREHPIAGKLFDPDRGKAEQAMFWRDEATGIMRRALVDWSVIPVFTGGRPVIADYKTTTSAHPEAIAKSVYSWGYHQQEAWYRDGIEALELAIDPAFVFVFQEKTPPFLINVIQLDDMALHVGRAQNRRAIDLYVECTRTGIWPGYPDNDIPTISLPRWAEKEAEVSW